MAKYGFGVLLLLCSAVGLSASSDSGRFFAGQDLHLSAPMGIWMQPPQERVHWLILEDGAHLTIGDNRIQAERAVVRLEDASETPETTERYYRAFVYLEGNVTVQRGGRAKTTPMTVVEGADALAVSVDAGGQVMVTVDTRKNMMADAFMADPLTGRAQEAYRQMRMPRPVPPTAMVPKYDRAPALAGATVPGVTESPERQAPTSVAEPQASVAEREEEAESMAPVHVTALWEPAPEIDSMVLADGRRVVTVRGRFYLWQRHPERGLIEFMADNAVLYVQGEEFQRAEAGRVSNELASGRIESVYLQGNIVMTEGRRVTRADEIFYHFLNRQALVVNAEMRTYDDRRQVPIYVIAERLRQISANMFEAQNVRLTSSEFYLPQVSLSASQMVLVTPEELDAQEAAAGEPADDSAQRYTGIFDDVRAKYYDFSFFAWPGMTSDFVRPDLPISRARIGNDSDFGVSLETRWHLYRLLGRKEPPGVESRLALDYFSKRGVGAGIETEYERPNSYGWFIGYLMKDRGEDDLGRISSRKNLEPDRDLRGRFTFRHREYLPYDWQMTVELSYLSDRHFLESMYRGEFYTDKGQETLIYLKRLSENTGFSILNKIRINDFETTVEELPTVEYHMTGQSFWSDRLTFYSDNRISRLRNRYDEDNVPANATTGDFYTFASTRNEVGFPLLLNTFKLVPFAAGTYNYEDHDEFDLALDGTPVEPEDNLLLGEYGLRASTVFWKADPTVRSTFWDLNGLRHIVTPHFEAVWYEQNDPAIKMRDTYNLGVSQRWQTRRGPAGRQETVDWMRLDMDLTWVDNPADSDIAPPVAFDPTALFLTDSVLGLPNLYGPAGFIFNDPSIPDFYRRNYSFFGLVRNSLNADYEWLVSDTFAFRSDLNYDLDSGRIQQFNVGVSRFVYPDLSYYIGSRYLRPLILDIPSEDIFERGSNAVVGAITYRINDRYTAVFSQEYNFDFGKGVRSDLTLIRQYHRLYYAFNFTLDESLDRTGMGISVWPQGVDELAIGSRKYMGLTGAIQEY
jgi:hypothetical protein